LTEKNQAAVALGRLGGSSRSPAKIAAALANIAKSKGRPKGSKNKSPRRTHSITGELIPRCHCGLTVYANGLCYNHQNG
jgi:hypothetical protein